MGDHRDSPQPWTLYRWGSTHGLQTPREEIAFTARPKIQSQSQIFSYGRSITPPLWTDLVKMFSRKLRHASSFSLERTDFKNEIFENIHWAHSEDAKVAEVKRPRNPK